MADTGLIWRRWKLGNPTDRPDRLHFHQLTLRFLEIRFFGRDLRHVVNPISTIVLVPLISTPQAIGVIYWNNTKATTLWTVLMIVVFLFTYIIGIKIAKKSRLEN